MSPAILIAAGIVIAVAGSRLYGTLTRRRSGSDQRSAPSLGVGDAPAGSVQAYATAQGWRPVADLGPDELAADYVHSMLRNMLAGADDSVGETRYHDLYTGQADGRSFTLGNAAIGVGGTARTGSVCVLHLGQVLPPLFVNLRANQPFIRVAMKEIPLESEDFNRRFQVMALDRKYVTDVISERTMALLMQRDDWVFALGFNRLGCVCKAALASADDYRGRLDAVSQFASLIPAFVGQERGANMPSLPDGTTLDLFDPASRDTFKTAVLAMSPEERQQFLAQVQENGARFLAGMFGKELPPEVLAKIASHFGSANPPSSS